MFSYIWSDNSKIEVLPEYSSHYVINSIVPVIWLEHCLECAMPLCYKSCEMFEDRGDGRCRRFNNGTSRFWSSQSQTLGATVDFRRWGKLESVIRTDKQVSLSAIAKVERRFNRLAAAVEKPCRWLSWKWHRPSRLIENYFDEIYIPKQMKSIGMGAPISGLLVVAYNHDSLAKTLHFDLKQHGASILHTVIKLEQGWNETLYEFALPDNGENTLADIYVDNDETAKITFQTLDFVNAAYRLTKKPASKVKCVAWDLDNTMWKGIIGDDGKSGVSPFEQSVSLVKRLDEMGIIQTVVSKNEFEIAWDKLKEMGLSDYFIYPAINWNPKSQNLRGIADALNINIDTFAVIDDSEFERQEIKQALPQVRIYDASETGALLNKPEFDIPITAESRNRRESYQTEAQRKTILASWTGDYDSFLKDCEITLELETPIPEEDMKRCFELIQRSNQYNVTLDRRSEEYLRNITDSQDYKTFAFRVSDKFGHYGIVGFASIEVVAGDYYLRDFVMSCRVAKKTVEKAFFSYVTGLLDDQRSLFISVEKTDRNNPVRTELKKLGMKAEIDDETTLKLSFKKGESKPIVCDTIRIGIK